MAYRGYHTDIAPDFDMGGNVVCTEGAIRHDPDANPPQVIVMMRLKASSGSNRSIAGTLYIDAEYTDGTTSNLQSQATAVSGISTDSWYVEHEGTSSANDLQRVSNSYQTRPYANPNFPVGSVTIPLHATKVLKEIRVDWRPN